MLTNFRRLMWIEVCLLALVAVVAILPVMLGVTLFGDPEVHRKVYFSLSLAIVILFHVFRVSQIPPSNRVTGFFGGLLCIVIISVFWLDGGGTRTLQFRELFGYHGLCSAIVFAVAWPVVNALAVLIAGSLVSPAK